MNWSKTNGKVDIYIFHPISQPEIIEKVELLHLPTIHTDPQPAELNESNNQVETNELVEKNEPNNQVESKEQVEPNEPNNQVEPNE